MGGLVELGEDELVRPHVAEPGGRQLDALLAGGGRQDQMNLVRLDRGEDALQFVQFQRVIGAAAGGVDENELAVVHPPSRLPQFFGAGYDPER